MKLIRFTLSTDYTPDLADCLIRHEPDLLQLDIPRSHGPSTDDSSKYAGDFRAYLRDIHKALYLSSSLKVVTNAGGSNVVACMEKLAAFLIEHGNADLPIAAIRGGNLIDSLDQIVPKDSPLQHQKVLSVDVEIGAGPIAAALAEGARIVVCGEYDKTAPFLAAGVNDGFCSWQDKHLQGELATASQFEGLLAETTAEGVVIESAATDQLSAIRRLGAVQHADLTCDYSHLELIPNRGKVTLSNVKVEAPSDTWSLKFISTQAYRADALVSTEGDQRVQLSRLCEQHISQGGFTIKAYVPAERSELDEQLVKLSYQSATLAECQQFLATVESFIREQDWAEIVDPRPTTVMNQQTTWLPISRHEVTFSVETRPASEWL